MGGMTRKSILIKASRTVLRRSRELAAHSDALRYGNLNLFDAAWRMPHARVPTAMTHHARRGSAKTVLANLQCRHPQIRGCSATEWNRKGIPQNA